MNTDTHQVPQGPFKFLWESTKPYTGVAFLAILFVAAASILSAIVPYLFKRIVDVVTGVEGFGSENIWFWVFAYVLLSFVAALCWRGSGFAGMRWATGVRATGREKLTHYVTQHSYKYFSNRFAGALGAKLRTATEGLKSMVESILWDWLGFILKLVVGIGLVIYTNLYIGLLFIAWLIVITPVNYYLGKKRFPLSMAAQAADTHLTAHTVDVLTNINAMRDYARTSFELDKWDEVIRNRRQAGLRNWMYGEWVLVTNNVFESIFVAGVIFATTYSWNLGMITAGDILMILTLILSFRRDLEFLAVKFNGVAETLGQVKEGLSDILHDHEVVDKTNAEDLDVNNGEIVFEDLSFGHDDRLIFPNLNLTIRPGERVGLIGRSGAGKSTLMKLLTRQFDLKSGAIIIDGQDISGVRQESLRNAVSVVPQEPMLFHRSLRENIKYGKLDATDEEIVEAAKHAQAHNFIEGLPKKYETLVGERGVKLSGGERQRVAIARAFLKNAKILLLDEATSSLDSESEVAVQKALHELMENKTVIAIAHRLSTLRAMDRLVVMDDGKIVEDGTHEDLIKKGGIYAELWAHQAGGFIKDS